MIDEKRRFSVEMEIVDIYPHDQRKKTKEQIAAFIERQLKLYMDVQVEMLDIEKIYPESRPCQTGETADERQG